MTAVELLYNLESDILMNMIRLLKRGAVGSATWQAEKLQQLGTLRSMNREAIQKSLPRAIKAAHKEIAQRGMQGASVIDAFASAQKLKLPPGADAKLDALLSIFNGNLAQSVNRMSATMLGGSELLYTRAVESTTAQVLAGSLTGRQAIAQTAGQWASQGLRVFTDKAGRNWTTEAYAQTLVRTTANNARRDATLSRMDDYGLDLVEVSSHADARDGCAPYQGKVYSRTGQTKGYPTLSETSYGEPDGLFGINCRHQMYPYLPGTKKTYSAYPLGETEEKYQESQKQRQLERSIRQAKRGLEFAKESGEVPEVVQQWKDKVSGRQSAMRDFIDTTDRTRRYDREQTY